MAGLVGGRSCPGAGDDRGDAGRGQVPVVIGEFGQDSCGFDYMQQVDDWADAHDLSYLSWTWNPWGCSTGGVLIKDLTGTPETGIGEGVKAHLLAQNPYA